MCLSHVTCDSTSKTYSRAGDKNHKVAFLDRWQELTELRLSRQKQQATNLVIFSVVCGDISEVLKVFLFIFASSKLIRSTLR